MNLYYSLLSFALFAGEASEAQDYSRGRGEEIGSEKEGGGRTSPTWNRWVYSILFHSFPVSILFRKITRFSFWRFCWCFLKLTEEKKQRDIEEKRKYVFAFAKSYIYIYLTNNSKTNNVQHIKKYNLFIQTFGRIRKETSGYDASDERSSEQEGPQLYHH